MREAKGRREAMAAVRARWMRNVREEAEENGSLVGVQSTHFHCR
jgi:hypothetical protein